MLIRKLLHLEKQLHPQHNLRHAPYRLDSLAEQLVEVLQAPRLECLEQLLVELLQGKWKACTLKLRHTQNVRLNIAILC